MSIFSKCYERILWKNFPSKETSLDEQNLNKMDKAIDELDNRIIELSGYSDEAEKQANLSKSYAVGTDGEVRPEDITDNAKYYKEQSLLAKNAAENYANNASQSASEASNSKQITQEYMETTHNYLNSANDAKYEAVKQVELATEQANNASQSANDALEAKKSTEQYKNEAENAKNQATEQANNASQSAESANTTKTEVEQIKTDVQGIKSDIEGIKTDIDNASQSASLSANNASESEDNAKYYMEKSKEYSGQAAQGVPIATEEVVGKTKPDGITLTIDSEGTLKVVSDSQLNESSENPIQNKAVTQVLKDLESNVPKLVKVDNKTVFMAEDGTLSAKGGSGTSIAPKPTVEPTITNGNAKVTIKWGDPEDSIIDGITLSTWAGTKLVMNENNYPTDENDGTLIVDNKERDKYKTNGCVVSGLENGKTYYFALFPYNTDEIYNYQTTNRLLGNPSLVKLNPCTNMSIATAMGKATIKWTDPEASKTVDGNTATWVKTVLVYKEGSIAPTSPSDGNIAVEETTRNTYQSSGYEVSGLTNGLQYSFSLFAISNENSISDPTSVNARLWSTVVVTTEESSLYGQNVTLTYGESSKTVTFSSTGTASVEVPYIGEVNISATDGSDTATTKVTITAFEQSYSVELSFLKIVTFQNGTDEEIAAMVNAHYAGKINIADYWSTEDRRLIHLNAMSATGVSESHHADDYYIVIAGINHDNLTSGGKAAITLCLERILFKDTTTESYSFSWSPSEECGYMNSSSTNVGGWENCARRTWCNEIFFNALPSWAQSLIKPVDKLTSAGNQSTTIKTTSDKVFLFSEVEILGTNTYSAPGEGEQYDLFKITTNRYKKPAYSGYNSTFWWERSPHVSDSTIFCYVNLNGSAYYNSASNCFGLVPAFCF